MTGCCACRLFHGCWLADAVADMQAAQPVADLAESETLGLPEATKSTSNDNNKNLGPNEVKLHPASDRPMCQTQT